MLRRRAKKRPLLQREVDLDKAKEAFGGSYQGLADALTEFTGERVALSTVHGWKRRGHIPSWRQQQIKAMAQAQKKSVCFPARHTVKRKRAAHHKRIN